MWDQIRRNQSRSSVIVVLMGVLLVAVGLALGMYLTGTQDGALLGGAAALGLWFLQWIIMRSQGDDILLRMAKAREIQKQDHPTLHNVVEEMTIAAGLDHMPRVFVVDDPSPNAFAVGRDPRKASVAVTIGLLKALDRDELQGVIAHEIGHVKNRDVALMTTAGIMVGAVVLLAELGLRAMWWGGGRAPRDSGGKDGGGQAVLFLISILLLLLAPLFAQLVYFALSRRREYLADASGARFTRYPEGLASALEKIGGLAVAQADQSRVTAPMYIVRPLRQGERRSFSRAFLTHPPIEERVQILRSMGGRADWQAYDDAYRKTRGRGRIVGLGALEGSEPVAARSAAEVRAEGATPAPAARLREASNAYLAGSGYTALPCSGCGAILKVPPKLRDRVNVCPRCRAPLSLR